MAERLNYAKAFPEGTHAMINLTRVIGGSGLERSLQDLVKVRASQLNGCAYCIDMHTRDARANGETEQRLYALSAWRETPFFTARERAALAWTEALTDIQQGHAADDVHEQARRVRRSRAYQTHVGDHPDQRLEAHRHRLPRRAGKLSAGGAEDCLKVFRGRKSAPDVD